VKRAPMAAKSAPKAWRLRSLLGLKTKESPATMSEKPMAPRKKKYRDSNNAASSQLPLEKIEYSCGFVNIPHGVGIGPS